jgi:curved DNA-binding protein CbpA
MIDAFQRLGLSPCLVLPTEVLSDAYREAGKVMHPDAGGAEDEFANLRNAFVILSSPAQRLKCWLSLRGNAIELRGSVDAKLMDFFSKVGALTQQAEGFVRKREATQSALGLAMLESETQQCREDVEAAIAELDLMIAAECAYFPGFEIAPSLDVPVALQVLRNLTFQEKWRLGLRACYSRLV